MFGTLLCEVSQMLHLNAHGCLFDSTKLEQRFSFTPAPYADSHRDTVRFITQAGPGDTPR